MADDDRTFDSLKEYLSRIPGVAAKMESGCGNDGLWWVKFALDIEDPLAWSVVQELGHVLNYMSAQDRLPAIFMPVSPAPYMSGGPREYLEWIIESKDRYFEPATCLEWLEGRLPRPVEDLTKWKMAEGAEN